MDNSVPKSCWGVTAKAIVGFAGLILLAWLVGGAEHATVRAASGGLPVADGIRGRGVSAAPLDVSGGRAVTGRPMSRQDQPTSAAAQKNAGEPSKH